MSAKVVGASGGVAGLEFWIEEEVVRIGSDAACEIAIPSSDLASHVVTLEYRQGEYLIHNRESGAILLGGRPLPERASAAWAPGAELQLSRSVVLNLVISGDPAPARQEVAAPFAADEPWNEEREADDEEPAEEPAKAGASKHAKSIVQAVITAVCIAGAIFMLSTGGPSPQASAGNRRQQFETLFASADTMEAEVRQRLQAAWAAEGMTDREPGAARRQYAELVELLHRRLAAPLDEDKKSNKRRELDREILEFAESGLASAP
ncbi:MAG TPA: FHA domain-containing protein [Pirellulales bacterium]|nr:FHA domain-containing protein [Pirellulales bacterium]